MSKRTLPTGTITFLASDIEGSTRLVQEVGPAIFRAALERHNAILRHAFATHGGTERGTQGDSFLVMFSAASAAVSAAAEAQMALAAASWPHGAALRVRMGIHTGIGTLGGDDYVGIDVHRAARIASAAHGGQVLLSDATRALAAPDLPPGVRLRSLGEHKLKDLARPEQLAQLVIDGVPSEFPPIRSSDAGTTGNLPARLTTFIGRESELEELGRLVDEHRLVTLIGPGGTGKSSLAVELARRKAPAFGGGAWLVRLESVIDPNLVASTIATALGLVETPGLSPGGRLVEYLAGRSILLVLDNFEQLLPAGPLVGELLASDIGLRVLVTSRAPLRLMPEQEFAVRPLATPGRIDVAADAMRSPAVQLFVDRARRVNRGYELTTVDAPAVAELCRRLDGLPLGIELAASRVALLPVATIAARLAERLDLPGGAPRDLPARQQSMERAIAWSYDLLDPPAQRLLARFSVFRGGCRLEEAMAVCGPDLGLDVLDGLSVLVEHSLVQPAPGPDGARFSLLGTIQSFASARLVDGGEESAVSRRHALAYLDLAETAAQHLPSGHQLPWLGRLDADHDNLRAAVLWAIERGESDVGLRFGTALWRFWQIRGHIEEGRGTMARLLHMPGADTSTPRRLRALEADGGLRYWSADLPGADARYKEQLDLARTLGDVHGTADALFNLSHTRSLLDQDQDAAEQMADEAARMYREVGDERGEARVAWTRVNLLMQRGGPGVEQLMLASLQRFEEIGDDWYVALTQGTLGWEAFMRGDYLGALRWGLASLHGHHVMGDVASEIIFLRGVAVLLVDLGMPEEAAVTISAFDSLCQRSGIRPPAFFEQLGPDARGRREVDVAPYPDAVARGTSMSIDETIDYVTRVGRERLGQAA